MRWLAIRKMEDRFVWLLHAQRVAGCVFDEILVVTEQDAGGFHFLLLFLEVCQGVVESTDVGIGRPERFELRDEHDGQSTEEQKQTANEGKPGQQGPAGTGFIGKGLVVHVRMVEI